MKMRYILVAALLSACSQTESVVDLGPKQAVFTPDYIQKSEDAAYPGFIENTPFVWKDGRMLTLLSNRQRQIFIMHGPDQVSRTDNGLMFASAIVNDGVLHVFGTKTWDKDRNGIYHMTTTDLVNWTEPEPAIAGIRYKSYFNSSVAPMPDGSFIMAYETCEGGTTCFNARFAKSTDLVHWETVGEIFKPNEYAACPTIRYVDGYYVVFWLRIVGHYATWVSRSTDLVHWEDSNGPVLSSYGYPDDAEGYNNSDLDLVELENSVLITYATGDQLTWGDVKEAYFEGSLSQLVNLLFSTGG